MLFLHPRCGEDDRLSTYSYSGNGTPEGWMVATVECQCTIEYIREVSGELDMLAFSLSYGDMGCPKGIS